MTAPTPVDPTAEDEAAVMELGPIAGLLEVAALALKALTRAWTRWIGALTARPAELPPQFLAEVAKQTVQILGAMNAAAQTAENRVDGAQAQDMASYRATRMVSLLSTEMLQRSGFDAVQTAVEQPRHLHTEIRGAVSAALIRDHVATERAAVQRIGGGWGLIWVPERDACVRCIAYAGQTVTGEEPFPAGLTFGPRLTARERAFVPDGPPLHRHCRCEVQMIYLPHAGSTIDAARREAERSVAKGWALESESSTVRAAAAERLLQRATRLPSSVVVEAKARLRDPANFRRTVGSTGRPKRKG